MIPTRSSRDKSASRPAPTPPSKLAALTLDDQLLRRWERIVLEVRA